MDPLFIALSFFRRRKYKECEEKCDDILDKDPSNQSCWLLKMKTLTKKVYIDQLDIDDNALALMASDETTMAVSKKTGTSLLQKPSTRAGQNTSFGLRNMQRTGRLATGYLRPDTKSSSSRSGLPLRDAIATAARHTSRTVTRAARLATATMATMATRAEGEEGKEGEEAFLNLSRLDMREYALKRDINKHLYEYIYYREGDVKKAFELASLASRGSEGDWWWKLQLARCLSKRQQLREALQMLHSSVKQQAFIESYLYLSKIYLKLDQPQSALACLDQGLAVLPNSVSILLALARVHELQRGEASSVRLYSEVLQQDFMHVEAIACIGTMHFYDEKPEVAVKYFQRLVQMGVLNAESYNNLGLCCFQSQQLDACMTCFKKALNLSADDDTTADIWFNIAHVALSTGDLTLASQCYQLSLAYNDKHSESYNNLAVIEHKKGKVEMTRAFLQSSFNSDPSVFEPHYNYALVSKQLGDLEASYNSLRKALNIDPEHAHSLHLFHSITHRLLFE